MAEDYYMITSDDIGAWSIFAFGATWIAHDFIGIIRAGDVGKRVYRRGDIVQVENDEQRERRLVGL